eukprot:Gb_02293 [translate_table: standard]
MVIGGILLNSRHLTNLFAPALQILVTIKYQESVDFAEFILKKVERNIIFWQEGKEHEIIYLGILQLIINQALSKAKKESIEKSLRTVAETLLDMAKGSKVAEKKGKKRKAKMLAGGQQKKRKPTKYLQQVPPKELEMEKYRAEFPATLEEKGIEIALLRTENTLKEYGLASPIQDLVRSPRIGEEESKPPSPDLLHDIHDSFPKTSKREEDLSGQKEDKTMEIESLRVKLEECRIDPGEKNLIAEAFMTGAFVSNELTFLVNMTLMREASYEIHWNPVAWEDPFENLQKAFVDIHEYYLKEFGGAEVYVEKLRDSVMEWHSNKAQMWNQFIEFIQKRIIYWLGPWLGTPHNSEATQGELPGRCNLREVMYNDSVTQKGVASLQDRDYLFAKDIYGKQGGNDKRLFRLSLFGGFFITRRGVGHAGHRGLWGLGRLGCRVVAMGQGSLWVDHRKEGTLGEQSRGDLSLGRQWWRPRGLGRPKLPKKPAKRDEIAKEDCQANTQG